MKKLMYMVSLLFCCAFFTACSDDDWSNEDAPLQNVYYFGFEDWVTQTKKSNSIEVDAAHGATAVLPMQFWCEYIRSYDVVTYYWVVSNLTLGTDYQVVDDNGNPLTPGANGAYLFTWPQAKKGVKNVNIKALNGAEGKVVVQTFDPASDVELSNQDVESTVQTRNDQYEVRIFTQNYMATVNIK
ncbi:hypothetical protein HPS57_05950 [Prevotella sp. PINT]|jgi:hypothetical protein|uniref:hypothetical protein n=1 Tax=Palleniella intestinalis TaxID=2736291 RepID=UPI0015582E03|nr:hypothetical protein [Palleniella intestinalis]NPD81513.1 hypothetical protein [Palleniella intestinalis]